MLDMKEQYACVKFCVKLQKKGTEIFSMFKVAFGGQTVGRTQVFLGVFKVQKLCDVCWKVTHMLTVTLAFTELCIMNVFHKDKL